VRGWLRGARPITTGGNCRSKGHRPRQSAPRRPGCGGGRRRRRWARGIRDPNAPTTMCWAIRGFGRVAAGRLPDAGRITAAPAAHALQPIEGTSHSQGAPIHDVQIDHGGPDVCMTKQRLYGSNVIAVFEQ
jgi:hypothetical protein